MRDLTRFIIARRLLGGTLTLLLAACGPGRNDGDRPVPVQQERLVRTGHLEVVGAPAMVPLMSSVARRYEALHPGVTVTVRPSSNEDAISATRGRRVMVGMVARPLVNHELDLQAFPIARDGIGVMTRAEASRTDITTEELAQLVRMAAGASGSGGRFRNVLIQDLDGRVSNVMRFRLGINMATRDAIRSINTPGDLLPTGAVDPGGLLFLPLAMAQRLGSDERQELRLIRVNGYAPTERNFRHSHYPLLLPLVLVTRELPEGEARTFINFALSPQAIELVRQAGLIPYVD